MDGKTVYQAVPEFTGRNVPVSVVAKVMGKDKQFVRQGMIHGNLPIGSVFKKEGSNQYDYYISPKLLWEFTGFIVPWRNGEGL